MLIPRSSQNVGRSLPSEKELAHVHSCRLRGAEPASGHRYCSSANQSPNTDRIQHEDALFIDRKHGHQRMPMRSRPRSFCRSSRRNWALVVDTASAPSHQRASAASRLVYYFLTGPRFSTPFSSSSPYCLCSASHLICSGCLWTVFLSASCRHHIDFQIRI